MNINEPIFVDYSSIENKPDVLKEIGKTLKEAETTKNNKLSVVTGGGFSGRKTTYNVPIRNGEKTVKMTEEQALHCLDVAKNAQLFSQTKDFGTILKNVKYNHIVIKNTGTVTPLTKNIFPTNVGKQEMMIEKKTEALKKSIVDLKQFKFSIIHNQTRERNKILIMYEERTENEKGGPVSEETKKETKKMSVTLKRYNASIDALIRSNLSPDENNIIETITDPDFPLKMLVNLEHRKELEEIRELRKKLSL